MEALRTRRTAPCTASPAGGGGGGRCPDGTFCTRGPARGGGVSGGGGGARGAVRAACVGVNEMWE